MKQTAFTLLLLALQLLPLVAQKKSDTTFVFRFASGKDVFYVPFKENEAELQRLSVVVEANKELLQAGKMYIAVSSYARLGNAEQSATRMAYLRNHRVKSELITFGGVNETNFVTDKHIRKPYNGENNVVVIVVPASVDKVAQIAGEQAAETVRTYYREQAQGKATNQEQALAGQAAREVTQRAVARQTEEERTAEPRAQAGQATAENKRLEAEQAQARLATKAAKSTPYTLALRANLLRWATLTPDVGLEWRITRDWAVVVNGTWSSWSWDNCNRRYALWEASPAIHYYIGKQKRGYIGAMYHIGEFNYKLFSDTGKQGDLQGGSIVGGYQLPIGKRLMLDFNLGIGCTNASYDTYTVTDEVRIRTGSHTKNYWGINKAGVTLVWKLF